MAESKSYSFAAPVLRLEHGLRQHYVPIPHDIAEALKAGGARRVNALLNGKPFNRGIVGRKDGEKYLMLGMPILREIGAEYGDLITVDLEADPDPDHVEYGEELVAALDQDPEAAERFYGMTPGRRRGLAYYVNGGKRVETRVKRALEIARKLRTRTLHMDLDE